MFVVCWVYSRKALVDEKPWIMVLNKNRGWELPGVRFLKMRILI